MSSGTSASNVRKRETGGDGNDRPTKRQKKLTNEEKQEETFREYAKDLGEAVDRLQQKEKFLFGRIIHESHFSDLSNFCQRVQKQNFERTEDELSALQDPVRTLDDKDLSKLDSSEKQPYCPVLPTKPFLCSWSKFLQN